MTASPKSSLRKQVAGQVRKYFATLPPDSRKRMKDLRKTIRSAAPGAVDHFSYRIPGFKLDDKPLVWYACFSKHTSLYPITAAIQRALASELKGYATSTGTVRLPLDRPLPTALVRRLVKARIAEVRKARRNRQS